MRRSSPLATGCFLGLLVLIVVLGKAGQKWQDWMRGDRDAHRPDSTLIANFRQHRPELEELVALAQRESYAGTIEPDWSNIPSVTQDRLAIYARLFQQIGAPHGLSRDGDGDVHIFMSQNRMLNTGSTKGFYISRKQPDPIVASLDSFSEMPRDREGIRYRHLEGPWYLFYEWAD